MTVLATSHPKSVAAPDVSAFIFLMTVWIRDVTVTQSMKTIGI